MLAHGQSVRRLREVGDVTISVVDNLLQYYPASVTDRDRAAARRQWNLNSWVLLDALFKAELGDEFREHFESRENADFSHVRDGDLDVVASPVDEFGVNYFTSFKVAADPDDPERRERIMAADGPQSPFGWTIDPRGLLDSLRVLADRWTGELPLFIGECGIGQIDSPRPDGRVRDPGRVEYLYLHLDKVLDAIDEGIPVTGFYVWSLMDNYEWDDGYAKRFGLHYTHYDRPEKYTIKDSGRWYAELCRTGELSPDLPD